MRRLRYVILDVFAAAPFAGNPLAVFPEAEGATGAQMQALAKELNLAETTFVLPPTDPAKAAARVRIFTPFEELPYAGHPSVGTHWLLAEEGRHAGPADGRTRIVQEVGAGLLPMDVDRRGGKVVRVLTTQAPPRFGATFTPAQVAPILGLSDVDVLHDLPSQVVNTGIDWLLVPLRSLDALHRARLAPDARERLQKLGARQMIYPFALEGFEKDALSAARGLLAGEFEDPVTGSASGCLGAYLAKHGRVHPGPDGVARFTHTQGHGMGRPGRVEVEVVTRGGEPAEVRVGGACVRTMEGEALLP
jgi:trans-2,3-dihydro-3-hydroxyanthranilate isomerase